MWKKIVIYSVLLLLHVLNVQAARTKENANSFSQEKIFTKVRAFVEENKEQDPKFTLLYYYLEKLSEDDLLKKSNLNLGRRIFNCTIQHPFVKTIFAKNMHQNAEGLYMLYEHILKTCTTFGNEAKEYLKNEDKKNIYDYTAESTLSKDECSDLKHLRAGGLVAFIYMQKNVNKSLFV